MASGIVSVAILSAGQQTISRGLLALTSVLWLFLTAVFVLRLCRDGKGWRADAGRPAALTAVAGTAVLGARLTLGGWSWAGWALLAAATLLLIVLGPVGARMGFVSRSGGSFLLVVAPQSLAVLASLLAGRADRGWAALAALVPFVLGLALYVPIVWRFDARQLRDGAGDHWISGGALAISTLACAQISHGLSVTHSATWLAHPLRVAALVLWALTIAWLPVLVVAEIRWRRIAYDVRRWATVFPLGMYAAMSYSAGTVGRIHGLVVFGRVGAWVALAAWLTVALGWCASRVRGAEDSARS